MKTARRLLSALLAVWLAAAPTAQAAQLRQTTLPVAPVILPVAGLTVSALPTTAATGVSAQAAFRAGSVTPQALITEPAAASLAAPVLPIAAADAQPAAKAPQSSLPQLQQAAHIRLPQAAAGVFDGGKAGAGASAVSGSGSAGRALGAGSANENKEAPAPPPPGKKKSWLKRFHEATKPATRAEKWFERAWLYGTGAATAIPVLWNAAPFHSMAVTLPLAVVLPVAFTGTLMLLRVGRFLIGRAPKTPAPASTRRAILLAAAVGLTLASINAYLPTHFKPQIVEHLEHRLTGGEPARAVRGDSLDKAVIATLSENPVGREVLDRLRDRGGKIRLPTFFVRKEKTAIAAHSVFFDAVYLGEAEVRGYGWTVDEFLGDAEKQLEFVRKNPGVFAHELTHAAQARRSILEPGQFHNTMEYEYEAYMTEHFYAHEQLKAEPGTPLNNLGSYEIALENVEAYLRGLDDDGSYKENKHLDSPRYRKWKADLLAGWPAHQIEAYALLAERRKDAPFYLKTYRKQAAEIAEKHGLPLPPILQAPAEKK